MEKAEGWAGGSVLAIDTNTCKDSQDIYNFCAQHQPRLYLGEPDLRLSLETHDTAFFRLTAKYRRYRFLVEY